MPDQGYEKLANDEDDNPDSSHPTVSANVFSLLTFSWMNSIFKIGSKRPLKQSDFLPLHEDDRTRDLTERLQKEWNSHVLECSMTKGKQPKLWKCVLRMLSCMEIVFLLCSLMVESVCRVSQPLVLGLLLQSLSSTQRNHTIEYVCCFLLSLSGLSTALTQYSCYRFELIGLRLSSAIKGIIYLKIPLITQQNLQETTTGNVIDLVGNDVQRLEQAPRLMLTSLFAVFEVVAAVCLLLYFIGWQPLMGVLFMVLSIPCVTIISAVCAGLREKTAEVTDRRISLMNELVSGIRAIKAHAWEENYRAKVHEVRRSEIMILLKKNALLSIIESSLFTSRIVATFLAVLTLLLTGHVLSPATAFMVFAFMNVLRITFCLRLGTAIPLAFELFISFRRIERFLSLDNMPLDPMEYNQTASSQKNNLKNSSIGAQLLLVRKTLLEHEQAIQEGIPGDCLDSTDKEVAKLEKLSLKSGEKVSVSNLTCKLNGNGEKQLLQGVSFEVPGKSLTVITGQVGSGKSTLLAAIAGEVIQSSGSIACSGTIAYVSQTAWVFSGTLRENVLFGEPYDNRKYTEVIDACALTEDINRFPNGDLTFVGERGVVLSGGQRARVSLARAVYADADVYLLDDPLSAVDAKVTEHIFDKCICKLLKDKIIILATYAEKHIKAADQIVVLHKGSVQEKGSFRELKERSKILDSVMDAIGAKNKEDLNIEGKDEIKISYSCSTPVLENFDELLEISEEDKATGNISFSLYWDYFRAGIHPVKLIVVLVLFLACQVVMVSPDVWLSYLTKKTIKFQQQETTLAVYASLFAAAVALGVIRAYLFFRVCLKSSENLHDKMVTSALQAPVAFFDTNPAGRILNRFSKDIGCVDELLPKQFLLTIQLMLFVFTAAVLPSFTSVWLCLISLPVFIGFPYLTWYYLKTSRELKRWESICRSPVFSHFSETMTGLDTIRTRRKERDFIDQFYRHQDLHNQAFHMVAGTTRWIGVRADVLSSLFITAVALVSVLLSQDPAFAGLALSYVLEVANNSQFAVRQCAEVENFMTSVERVMAYTNLEIEPGYNTKTLPPINWPHTGHVSFRNVILRYYPGGPQVLKNLSFEIHGKTKLGIVGRTGDGKSSIVAALLRMPEAEGNILIDDVYINRIQLQESRRCISVLSQTPVLFSGSLRRNLDPMEKHRDDELWNVLEEVKLNRLIENLEGKLDYELLERGENLSVGERQLICLARTLLQQSKIVILDEPTANVDPNTERTIWNTVHEKLKNSTVITIAHRLNTVKDCDVILVLREGQVAELDAINTLLAREGGVFYSMATSQSFSFR